MTRLAIEALGSAEERRAFHFYCDKTVPDMSDSFERHFWERLVPRLGQIPAIFHLVTALGSIHESLHEIRKLPTLDSVQAQSKLSFALSQSNKSIRLLLVDPTASSYVVRLTSCILFQAISQLLPEHQGHAHGLAGHQLIKDLEANSQVRNALSRSDRDLIFEVLGPALRHPLRSLAACVCPVSALRHTLNTEGIPAPRDWPSIPSLFHNLTDARDNLHDLYMWAFSLLNLNPISLCYNYTPQTRLTIRHTCRLWYKAVYELSQVASSCRRAAAHVLMAHYIYLKIITEALPFTTECEYDSLIPDFQALVNHVRQSEALQTHYKGEIRYTFELGIQPWRDLEIVGMYCRDPAVRRQAIEVMERMNHSVGPLDTTVPTRVMMEMMKIEESRLSSPPKTASDISEEARVQPHAVLVSSISDSSFKLGYLDRRDQSSEPVIEYNWIPPLAPQSVTLSKSSMTSPFLSVSSDSPSTSLSSTDTHTTSHSPTQQASYSDSSYADPNSSPNLRHQEQWQRPDFIFERTGIEYFNQYLNVYQKVEPTFSSFVPPKIHD